MTTDKRDLHADLAICNAATPGPWALDYDYEDRRHCVEAVNVPSWGGGVIVADCAEEADARFIAEARAGWPHAIGRAMAAEAEVDRLSGNLRAVFNALVGLLALIPGKLRTEEQAIIDRIRADIYKEATADDQR